MLLVLSLSNLALRVQAQPLKEESQQALKEALADEYQARAFYQAVLDKFGQVRPFSNIVHSEGRHAALVEELLVKYGIPIPEDTYQGKLKAPESLLAACEAGIKSEIANLWRFTPLIPPSRLATSGFISSILLSRTKLIGLLTKLRFIFSKMAASSLPYFGAN